MKIPPESMMILTSLFFLLVYAIYREITRPAIDPDDPAYWECCRWKEWKDTHEEGEMPEGWHSVFLG